MAGKVAQSEPQTIAPKKKKKTSSPRQPIETSPPKIDETSTEQSGDPSSDKDFLAKIEVRISKI